MSSWEGVQTFILMEICICVQIYAPLTSFVWILPSVFLIKTILSDVITEYVCAYKFTNAPSYPKLKCDKSKNNCVIKMFPSHLDFRLVKMNPLCF